ncbi:MAG: S-methyl-5-thioribose-1-phosphate isomerase [Anaerolineales bacterium]|nr:S-methyl-5-thioribose-1-phosphate isomerase [Anaerolineales bacterium]
MRTVRWVTDGPVVEMIDQRLLPEEFVLIQLHSTEEVAFAIKDMAVRGAPAIGATAAFGLALAGHKSSASSSEDLSHDLQEAADILHAARPTASNLDWALKRMLQSAKDVSDDGPDAMRDRLITEAQRVADQDVEINRKMGEHGAALLPDNATVIHHCNTGALATVDYGTALGVIRCAHEQGKGIHVFVDETRPRLQGARLTAWELENLGVPYEIITDNAAGFFLAGGTVDAVIVGVDRAAANGDVANKIGTYPLALAAKDNNVPFYVALPTSTIDLNTPSGDQIPIEERDPAEVLNLQWNDRPFAPEQSRARNPAFDVTPHRLITAFITEVGVVYPPYENGLREAVEKAQPT